MIRIGTITLTVPARNPAISPNGSIAAAGFRATQGSETSPLRCWYR